MTSTTATTVYPFIAEEDDNVDVPQLGTFREVVIRGEVSGYCLDSVRNDTQTKGSSSRYYVYEMTTKTAYRKVKFIRYGEDRGALIVVDFGEPVTEFPEDQQGVVQSLRDNGRQVLADKLFAMLRNVADDPDGPTVNFASMRDMAGLLAEYGRFSDPSISPDRYGIIHGQWRIVGDGLLVISFLGQGEILLTAQADETTESAELDISQRGWAPEIMGTFGHLVPIRD